MKGDLLEMAPSLTEAVYLQLRKELLACEIRPGEKLKIGDMAKHLGVNLGSVREALSRLTADGLVTFESQRGFRAAPVTLEDLRDLIRTRIEIEILCLKSAMESGGIEWETGIVASYHRLSRTPEFEEDGEFRTVSEAWVRAHSDFHTALLAACESLWMLRLRNILYNQSERYRRFSMLFTSKAASADFPPPQSHEYDHHVLMEAVLSRDTNRAVQVMCYRLNRTADLVSICLETGALPQTGQPNEKSSRKSKKSSESLTKKQDASV